MEFFRGVAQSTCRSTWLTAAAALHKAKGVGWEWGTVGQADKGLTFGSLKVFDIDTSEFFLVLWPIGHV